MKLPNYLVVILLFFVVGCSDYQKALKTEDPGLKNKLAQSLYEQGKYRKAGQLYDQLKTLYRGKPQAERIVFFMQIPCWKPKITFWQRMNLRRL